MVLNVKAWNKITLPNLDLLLKTLNEEEIYITRKILLNNIQSSFSVGDGQSTHGWSGHCQNLSYIKEVFEEDIANKMF